MSKINIVVTGTGYVGLSLSVLLSQHNCVTAVDIIPEKVKKINNHISPIQDDFIEKYLSEKLLNLRAILNIRAHNLNKPSVQPYSAADNLIIATQTN